MAETKNMSKYLSPELKVDSPKELPKIAGWEKTFHLFDQESMDAIEAAMAARRPLLIRGEPGTGKSQLARAAAEFAAPNRRLLIPEVVHARSESSDLQWRFDAVGRLGEAQAIGASASMTDVRRMKRASRLQERKQLERIAAERFLLPGPLWWAFDWESAQAQHCKAGGSFKSPQPERPYGWEPKHGCVVLIDEIDKADADLPNGLLETLGESKFGVPHRTEPVYRNPDLPPPLVIITTNEERELPPAFVRRCFVLHLRLPDDDPVCLREARALKDSENEKAYIDEAVSEFLRKRGEAHFGKAIADEVYREAARQLCEDRRRAHEQSLPKPGQAEYIDILRVLNDLAKGDSERQLEYLDRIARFALEKFQLKA
jgi:MoxR-like ATPase